MTTSIIREIRSHGVKLHVCLIKSCMNIFCCVSNLSKKCVLVYVRELVHINVYTYIERKTTDLLN